MTEARELRGAMVELAGRFGRRASALVTGMDEPLGTAIGTALEAIEARDFLTGARREPRLADVVDFAANEMLRVAGSSGEPDAAARLRGALDERSGLREVRRAGRSARRLARRARGTRAGSRPERTSALRAPERSTAASTP